MLILNSFIRHLKFKIFIHKVLYIFTLIEHFPTKQGLRQSGIPDNHILKTSLIEHFPTKQGLRLLHNHLIYILLLSHRAFSNKTRIKT